MSYDTTFATKESKAILEARAAAAAANMADYDSKTLLEKCEQIWEATQKTINDEERVRKQDAILRLWSAYQSQPGLNLKYVINNPLDYTFEWIDNDTGTGAVTCFAESVEGQYLIDIQARVDAGDAEAPIITADYVGSRWSGRLEDVSIEETSDGDQIVVANFLHDYENLKWIECFPTPFFPAIVQLKAWVLLGPSRWAALTTLFCNLLRDETPLTIPDDPLDLEQWVSGFNVNNWQIVVNPISFLEDMDSGTLWSLPIIRMKYWHDAFIGIIEDAELSVQCERWFEGDDPPWEGANLANGALVVSIVNKSGRYIGTSHGGTIFDGLVYTVDEFAEDFLDPTVSILTGQDMPDEYMQIGVKSTNKTMPYAIFRPGITPGVQSAKFTCTPAKAAKIITGGKSAPGVNEGISAAIQAIIDVVGDNVVISGYGIGSWGGAVDTILYAFYSDTVLAWTDTKSFPRAQQLGWSRYVEFFQDGADQAYTLNSLMAIRTGLWATRRWYSHEIQIIDSCPWIIGDNGVGHIWIGDRVGSTMPRDSTGKVWIDRIKKLVLTCSEDAFAPEWGITIGDDKKNRDVFEEGLERIRNLTSGLHDVGVV